ncbi:hypothetical protein OEA41_008834 [Lepraria neglecta]|uniref:Uncharacterized protein n=1 Tax=Lepraria neglecta TaxID=209136 RepID=A0AAE0DH52_9LECA|nr:hypothetical protein OEA41_008834 [Lepraria neglecta]
MDYLSVALTVLYYIAYPIFFVLSLLLSILAIVTAPLLYLGYYFLCGLWYPIHFLGKFETLYIFFGVAVLIGVLTGTSLHYASGFIISVLNLESQREEPRGRTLASFRRNKQRKMEDPPLKLEPKFGGLPMIDLTPKEEYMEWEWSKQGRGKGRNGLIPPNTILEEDSTEDGF